MHACRIKADPKASARTPLQARSYEEATNSLLGWYLRNAQTRALSHPLPVMRAREIDRWAGAWQTRGLLRLGCLEGVL